LCLPAAITKGANATGRSQSKYVRQTVSFNVDAFAKMLKQVCALNDTGKEVIP
jgi:hypothetical protein